MPTTRRIGEDSGKPTLRLDTIESVGGMKVILKCNLFYTNHLSAHYEPAVACPSDALVADRVADRRPTDFGESRPLCTGGKCTVGAHEGESCTLQTDCDRLLACVGGVCQCTLLRGQYCGRSAWCDAMWNALSCVSAALAEEDLAGRVGDPNSIDTGGDPTIPVLIVTKADGMALLALVGTQVTVYGRESGACRAPVGENQPCGDGLANCVADGRGLACNAGSCQPSPKTCP